MLADALRLLPEARHPLLVVLAGPNGAGKSTFYSHFLASAGFPFVNADLIARELAPDDPGGVTVEAVEQAAQSREALLTQRTSFVMETVFSDPVGDKLAFLRRAQELGYAVYLVFIGLDSPLLSLARVIQRVEGGGHDVPDEKIESRFPRTLANLRQAVAFVDLAFLFDNSRAEEPFRHVATYERGKLVEATKLRSSWTADLPGLGG